MSSPVLSANTHLVFPTSTTDSSSISSNFSTEEAGVSFCQQILSSISELHDVKNDQGLWQAVEAMINQGIQEISSKTMFAPSDMQHLLMLADAVVKLQSSSPEMLPVVLNLYMILETFAANEVQAEAMLKKLRSIVRGILRGLTDLIWADDSLTTPQGGGIHKLTMYLMSYIKLLIGHQSFVNFVLSVDHCENYSQDIGMNALDSFVRNLITCLVHKLQGISKLYESEGLQCIFMLDNVYFVLQQFQDPELKFVLQNDRILKLQIMVEEYTSRYLEYSWEPVLSCLEISNISFKEKVRRSMLCVPFNQPPLKKFNTKLGTTYAEQKSWRIEDPQLRQSLRERVSSRVLQCYEAYLNRCAKHQKHVVYTPQELRKELMELFEG